MKSFSIELPREVFQILFTLAFLELIPFCTFPPYKKNESGIGEGLLERHL